MAEATTSSDLPPKVVEFTDAVRELHEILSQLRGRSSHQACEQLGSLDKAKHELAYLYALNSVYWSLLMSSGKDAQAHDIKAEIGRVQSMSARVREFESAGERKADATVAKRMIKNTLWNQAQQSTSNSSNNRHGDKPTRKRSKFS